MGMGSLGGWEREWLGVRGCNGKWGGKDGIVRGMGEGTAWRKRVRGRVLEGGKDTNK